MPRTQTLRRPKNQRPGCNLVGNIDLVETPLITEMAAAAAHLARAIKSADGPYTEIRTSGGQPDLAHHAADVRAGADRIRRLLDELTAPYGLPEAAGPAAQDDVTAA
ncbi:hypothetical protein ACFYZH_31890 [Streptomyces abikoensis]|uniref:hypothetical protein n=1 Tax=Streptomyces abikoensis TaxID=97398 RepID=UPI0036BAA472